MTYYQVKPDKDQHTCYYKGIYQTTLIGGSLYTAKEMQRYHINPACVVPVEIPKSKIYWFFGARYPFAEVTL